MSTGCTKPLRMMIVRSLCTIFLLLCWVLQGKCVQGSSVLGGGSFISAIRNSLFDNGKRHQRSFGFSVRKIYGKLAIHSNKGDVVHLSTGEGGLLAQKFKGKAADQLAADRYAEDVHGIFGFYELPTGYFAAVIKDSEPLAATSLPDIRKIKKVTLIKVPSSPPVAYQHLNATELELEQARAETLLLRTFKQHSFYFSTGSYDISNTLQNNAVGMQNGTVEPKEKFFWNLNAIAPLMHENCSAFITPVVNAWIDSTRITYEGADYCLTLISRRSRRRQGPRYIKRGSDELGDVANFVETEQIVQRADGKATSSFAQVNVTFCTMPASALIFLPNIAKSRMWIALQIRGSIPLFWTQPADWKLRPPVLTVPSTQLSQHSQALKTHLADMVSTYFTPLWGGVQGDSTPKRCAAQKELLHTEPKGGHHKLRPSHTIHMINLIDKKGVQGKLGQLWNKALTMVHTQPVSVFRRFGLYSPHKEPAAAYKIGSNGKTTETTTSEMPAAVDDTTDRNATSILTGAFNVTAQDLLRLHSVREPHTSSDAPRVSADPECSVSDKCVAIGSELIWFDYHHKCHDSPAAVLELFPLLQPAMHTDNLYLYTIPSATVTSQLASTRSAGAQVGDQNLHILSTQKHIIRTNCMDCLDRTNVMQSVVSRWVLMRQIVSLRDAVSADAASTADVGGGDGSGAHRMGNATSARAKLLRVNHYKSLELPDKKMESEFRRLWTHNGDHLSVMYAGSRAMKRDVTQNGVRTQRGAVDDAMSAAQRFFVNNLRDEHKQLGIDLMLGLASYETLTRAFTSAGTGSGTGSGTDVVGESNGTDSSIISGGSVRVDSHTHRPKLRQYAPQRLLDTHKQRVQKYEVFIPAIPNSYDNMLKSPSAVPVAPGAVRTDETVKENSSAFQSQRASPRAKVKDTPASSGDKMSAVPTSGTTASKLPPSQAQDAQAGDPVQAIAPTPVDPVLARFESKVDTVLSDLLQEIVALQSSNISTAGKRKSKKFAKVNDHGSETMLVTQPRNTVQSVPTIELHSGGKLNTRSKTKEKSHLKTQRRHRPSYLIRFRNILLAPITLPLKYIFGW